MYFVNPEIAKNYYKEFDSIISQKVEEYSISDSLNILPKIQNFRLASPLNHNPPHLFHKNHNSCGGGILLSSNGNDGIENGFRISLGFWDAELRQACVNTYTDYPRINQEVSQHSFKDIWLVSGHIDSKFPRRSMQVVKHDNTRTIFAQGIKLPNGPKYVSALEVPGNPRVINTIIKKNELNEIILDNAISENIDRGGIAIWSNATNHSATTNSVIGIGLFDSKLNQISLSVYKKNEKNENSKFLFRNNLFLSILDSLGNITLLGKVKKLNPMTISILENNLKQNILISFMFFDKQSELIKFDDGNSLNHTISNPHSIITLSSGLNHFGFGLGTNNHLQKSVNFITNKGSYPAKRFRTMEESLLAVYDLNNSTQNSLMINSKLYLEDLLPFRINYKWVKNPIRCYGLIIEQ